jgi:hypothetical protein
MEYLKASGIAAEQIVMRFHGERYPLAPNTSEANRAKNRRVTILLERVPQADVPEAPETAPAPAAPAATS